MNMQPSGLDVSTFAYDNLLCGVQTNLRTIAVSLGDLTGLSSSDAFGKRGRLLYKKASDGKYYGLDTAETTIALNDVLVVDDFGSTTELDYTFALAKAPIPGTLHVVTVDQGTTTVVLDAGTDNGHGYGSAAGGYFHVDYDTGIVTVHFTSAPSDNDDLTYSYKHRGGVNTGLPIAILAEDWTDAQLNAGPNESVAFISGEFRASALLGYSAGYYDHMKALGMIVRDGGY